MFEKILVPLDISEESASVLPFVQESLIAEGEGILLHIIPPGRTSFLGEYVTLGMQIEEEVRSRAKLYLKGIVSQISEGSGSWRYEVVVSDSVADGIVDFARREEVDLIVMFSHDRKGLAKLIKGSIAEKVQKRAASEVQIFSPRELVTV